MKTFLLLSLFFALSVLPVLAQEEGPAPATVFELPEKAAEPKGGKEAFYQFLGQKLEYPPSAVLNGIEGTVYLRFIIDTTGHATGIEIVRGVHEVLDQEALRMLRLFSEEIGWIPASHQGKLVAMRQIMPFKFKLGHTQTEQQPKPGAAAAPTSPVTAVQEKKGTPHQDAKTEIFYVAEEEALPKGGGGVKALYDSIASRMEYPARALAHGIEGRVYVRFIIDETGTVTKAEVMEGRGLGYGLDEEAIRLIRLTEWTPAKQRGVPVKLEKVLPVTFNISKWKRGKN